MQFDNLDDANAWIAKAVKEFKTQRRDWLRVNAYFYALGMHGYELAIKEINTLLGDRPREHNGPYPEDGITDDMYDGEKMRQNIRAHLNLMDRTQATLQVERDTPALLKLEMDFPADMGVVPPVDEESQE